MEGSGNTCFKKAGDEQGLSGLQPEGSSDTGKYNQDIKRGNSDSIFMPAFGAYQQWFCYPKADLSVMAPLSCTMED